MKITVKFGMIQKTLGSLPEVQYKTGQSLSDYTNSRPILQKE
jgi:hypothetical protein